MSKTYSVAALLLLIISVAAGQRTQASGTRAAMTHRDSLLSASRSLSAPGNTAAGASARDNIEEDPDHVRRLASTHVVSPVTDLSPGAPHNGALDSRVIMLESSVDDIKRTLELLLDWLCQLPKENNAKANPGPLACNRGKKASAGEESNPTAVVEAEPSRVTASVGQQVDRARTRSQDTNDDGWTTVGQGRAAGEGTKPSTRTTQGSSGQRPSSSSGPISTADLQTFTEELIQKDINNVASQLRINRQGQTNSRAIDDQAHGPLVSIPASALNGPTIVAFRALLDNYDPNVKVKDVASQAEILEQNNFLNEVMKTQVMQHTEQFLSTKGKIRRPLKDVLQEIWFTMYRRAGRNEGSSGFEHSFIGELKDGKVSGFHNWIQFGHEEQDGDLDYRGFMKYVNLGNKGQVIKGRFIWLSESKPVGSLFVGTSPELEMALYTVCFLLKPDQQCQVKLNKKKFNIQTWTHNYKGKKLIGSAYPDI